MSVSSDLKQDIDLLLAALIESGACQEFNFPSLRTIGENEFAVGLHRELNSNLPLREVPYEVVYAELNVSRSFVVKLMDGALITLYYRVTDDDIIYHRLCFFPSPDLAPFHQDPEIYNDDSIYAEVLSRRIVPFPMRLDFDIEINEDQDVPHPKCHLTLGQYSGCRIPVDRAVRPVTFVEFLLRHFYCKFFVEDWRPLGQLSGAPRLVLNRADQSAVRLTIPD